MARIMRQLRRSVMILSILLLFTLAASADESMSLNSFLKTVEEQNLDLKVENAKIDSAKANAVGIALPAPMVGFNQMREDNGNKANGFEISQTIPFPTKLSSDHSARKPSSP